MFFLVVFSLACSRQEAPPPAEPESVVSNTEAANHVDPSESPDQPPRSEAAAALSVGDPPEIQLIEPGKEPRRALRWSIKPGLEQRLTIKTTVEAVGVLGGMLPISAHEASMTYDIIVKSDQAAAGERTDLTFRVKKAKADLSKTPTKMRPKIRKAAKTIEAARGGYSVDSWGLVTDVKLALPSDASLTARNMARRIEWSLLHMTAPFPEGQVGEGAKWSVASAAEQDGIRMNRFWLVKIAKLEGPLVDVKIEIEESAPPQTYTVPKGSSEMGVYLVGLNSKGTVEATWDLEAVLPRSASLEDASEKIARYKVDDRQMESSGLTQQSITMRRK